MRKLCRVPDEEDGSVIEDPIPISFIGPELDRKTTGVTSGIRGARLTTNSGEADGGADFFANGSEEVVGGYIREIVSYFEIAVGSSAFSVDLSGRKDEWERRV
jgi:hypothetical protein